jgi:5-methyltetrahydropteroyltriglutamate--homocysteine methyltransferase
MKAEYDAIYQAGIVLQLDCPDLPGSWSLGPKPTLDDFRKDVSMRLHALDHATRDIPPEQVRLHLCWGKLRRTAPHRRSSGYLH